MLHRHHGRRHFLQTAALFSTGLITSLVHPRRTIANDQSVEALVIGSGYGGSIAALRLGQAGINTVVLERGRRWTITPAQNTFATFRNPDGRAAWLSPITFDERPVDIYTGVLEFKAENGINVLCGAGVGGGSLVNNAAMVQPVREMFHKVFPSSLNYEELDRVYYPRVRSMLNALPIPSDILATPYYDTTRLFIKHATQAGFPNYLLDLAVNWDIVREEINGKKRPSTIIGEHWFGINSGAKNSLDRNYLPQAEETGFVEILPLHVATVITEVPGYGYRVSCVQINESGEVVEQKSITCRYLFLAAGSLGTSKLLVKAKATGALPRLNDNIGKFWGVNGDSDGTRSSLATITGKGGPAGAFLRHFDNPWGPIVLMDYPFWDNSEGIHHCLGMGIPPANGTFTYDASTDSVSLTWPLNSQGNKALLSATEYTYRILDKRNTIVNYKPKTKVTLGSDWNKKRPTLGLLTNASAAHPLGGAVIGKACDEYGRVLGYQGLYVVDGALIPGSTACANPALTIAALAERCMDRILTENTSGAPATSSRQV